MKRDSSVSKLSPRDLAPFLNGFYKRVAHQLGVSASFVIRVALGECKSKIIEDGLRRELEVIPWPTVCDCVSA
jgi:hypothetical protein